MAPRLPLEVVERIIDDIVEYDDNLLDNILDILHGNLSSIKACALVCHSLLPLCRKHIFAHVSLNERVKLRRPASPTSDDFYRLLSDSPHLAVYIRKLDYYVNKNEFVTRRFLWLSPMFKSLVKLRRLSIIYPTWAPGRNLDWMSLSGRKVLLPLLHLPTLTSIRLSTIRNFALADLAGCVNLKELVIQSLECSNGVGKFLEPLPATPAMLERFTINERNIRFVRQLYDARRPDGKPIIDFSSLKEITATVARLGSMTELFGMFRKLHKIKLSIVGNGGSRNPSESTLGLKGLFAMLKPSLPTLVDIDLTYYIKNDETYDGPLAGLCHELEKMASQNVVETIKLLIWVHPGYDCTRWGELDDTLMGSPEGWPALREVSLSFHVIMTSRDGSDKALRELPMTKLMENKRVQFDLEVYVFYLSSR